MNSSTGKLSINLSAIRKNYEKLCGHVGPGSRVGAVVKANAYGLGARVISPMLFAAGCQDFFVSSLDEALSLRQVLPRQVPVYILNGFYGSSADMYVEHGFIPALGSFMEIEFYRELATKYGRKLPAMLSLNTRMNRLGLGKIEIEKLINDKRMLEGLEVKIIMSHFACADDPDHPMNETQYDEFSEIARHFPEAQKSLANSSATFRHPKYHFDMVRAGAALYGLNPTPETSNPMRPVLTLNLPVIRTRLVYKDAHVGYSATYRFSKDAPLATVAAGYADGIFWSLSNRGALYWKGHRCPVRGRVSMDLTTIDLSEVPEKERPQPGDMMELIGPHQDPDALAADAGTIGYEVLTRLGSRYERIYQDNTKDNEPLQNLSINGKLY